VEGYQAVVPRARSVRVEALDHRGEPVVIEASGVVRAHLQHEIDHLNGKLYVDRMRVDTLATTKNFARHWGWRADRGGDRSVRRVAPRAGADGRREEMTI
jgi:peptide deformylase